jgi:hypothetical protein
MKVLLATMKVILVGVIFRSFPPPRWPPGHRQAAAAASSRADPVVAQYNQSGELFRIEDIGRLHLVSFHQERLR